jgi:WhiB family redox-sensing transcriptional regulator
MLPGHFPDALKPLYADFLEQFEQRRAIEVGDVPVAPLVPLSAPAPVADSDDQDAPSVIINAA